MGKRKKVRASEGKNWHHRKAKVNSGSGKISSGNMIEVDVLRHQAFHFLFQTKTAVQIAEHLTRIWIDPEWELIARKKEKPDGQE